MRHVHARHPQPDTGLIKSSDSLKLLRRCGALQCLEVDRMNGLGHGEQHTAADPPIHG